MLNTIKFLKGKKMKTTLKKIIAVLLVVATAVVLLASCAKKTESTTDTYTYKTYQSALGTNWNPHTWDTDADDSIRQYLSTPFVNITVEDSTNKTYQWIYLAATSVTDVTADHNDDMVKYGSAKTSATEGYVYEIKLNNRMKWENGEVINADTYIESMKLLLDPTMMNYRANLYINGESAVAGAYNYYYALSKTTPVSVSEEEAAATLEENPDTAFYFDVWEFWGAKGYLDANGNECPQYVYTNDTTVYSETGHADTDSDVFTPKEIFDEYLGSGYFDAYAPLTYDKVNENYTENYSYDTVGVYKVDDYTIRYVLNTYLNLNYFLSSLTDNWIVYAPLYNSLKDTTGELVTTTYWSSKETTMSYGPYKIESLQEDKQIVFTQNENWYLYTKNSDGTLTAMSEWDIDGKKQQIYKTTSIVVNVMQTEEAKLAFLKGELTDWNPSSTELSTYATSDRLYKAPETFAMSLMFNCGLDNLKAMDASKGNTNSVVLSNYSFRKAMSLAIDRAKFVTSTAGYTPLYSLINDLYYYDVYNDPTSIYCYSEEAMSAICDLYGVKYGDGTPYATLREAYDSITGYNLTEAKELMATACKELVAAGLYTAGSEIKVRVAWSAGSLSSDEKQLEVLLNEMINAAIEGSGFGKVTFEFVGDVSNRYDAIANGEYAIGYGAWGGAAFYPFTKFQVFLDPEQYSVVEIGCWDPTTEMATFTVDGKDYTMTWQDWGNSMTGEGQFAEASFKTKLSILSQIEENYLKKYYTIPLCSETSCSMLSYQCHYYVDEYNIMYGFGGMDLVQWDYTDAEWATFVANSNGQIDYE